MSLPAPTLCGRGNAWADGKVEKVAESVRKRPLPARTCQPHQAALVLDQPGCVSTVCSESWESVLLCWEGLRFLFSWKVYVFVLPNWGRGLGLMSVYLSLGCEGSSLLPARAVHLFLWECISHSWGKGFCVTILAKGKSYLPTLLGAGLYLSPGGFFSDSDFMPGRGHLYLTSRYPSYLDSWDRGPAFLLGHPKAGLPGGGPKLGRQDQSAPCPPGRQLGTAPC